MARRKIIGSSVSLGRAWRDRISTWFEPERWLVIWATVSRFDWTLILTMSVLVILGITTIYTVTYVTVGSKLAVSQGLFAVLGLVIMVIMALYDYRLLKRWAVAFYVVSILLLIPLFPTFAHHVPGVVCEFNACRWLNIGIRFQTSELAKLAIPILLGFLVARTTRRHSQPWWKIFFYLLIIAIPAVLILEQPDLGTAAVAIVTGLAVMLAMRLPWQVWIGVLLVVGICAPIGWNQLKPYQRQRIDVFLNPNLDLSSTGYNVRQAEIAVGSGGLMGRGFGQGSQSQLNFLPVAQTDFVFAGYAEATGYVGSLILVVLLLAVVWRALKIAENAYDRFGQLLAIGIASMFFIQITINIAMNIRLAPVTGITLPFVSYGGTSLVINMIAIGLLLSIHLRRRTTN